jgi:hypothetical protein
MEQFKYEIGGTAYVQRPLVLGQVLLLAGLLKHLPIVQDMGVQAIIASLGLKLPDALAIVLIPQDGKAIDKIDDDKRFELATEISFSIDPETVAKVIEDFFDCNPIASLLERFAGMTEKLSGKIKTMKEPGSSKPSSSSPAEISPREMGSFGDTPSRSASPI